MHQDAATRLQAQENLPRLTISDRSWKDSPSRLLLADLSSIKQLSLNMELWLIPGIQTPDEQLFPDLVDNLLVSLNQNNRPNLPGKADFFRALEDWSRYVYSELLTRGDMNAKAFSYAASIADTYWYMSPPEGGSDDRFARETWRKLLDPHRLREESTRVAQLAEFLDPYVAASLQYSLERWGIADILQKEGKNLSLSREKEVVNALEKQAFIWRELILGLNNPTDYLPLKSRRWTWFWHRVTVLFSLILFVFLLATAVFGLSQIFILLFPFFQSFIQLFVDPAAPQLDDLITFVSIFVSVLSVVWIVVRWSALQFYQYHRWLRRSILQYFVIRHTWWKPWENFSWRRKR